MKHIKFLILLISISVALGACKKQLDVRNPNAPTPESANTELGIIALAQGSVYYNGFHGLKYGGFFGNFFNDPLGYLELTADVVGVEAANQYINQFSTPNKITYDDGSSLLNPQTPNEQPALLHEINSNANTYNNPLYYQWAYMYTMNKALNVVLATLEGVEFTGDAESKKKTIQAWAYFWKGFAYSNIGSLYYAGLIDNEATLTTNDVYVEHAKVIEEANSNFDKSVQAAQGANPGEFGDLLSKLIPDICQVGNGGVLDATMWQHSVNTMKARNLLVNSPVESTDWATIAQLTADGTGISEGDKIFVAYSNATSDIFYPNGGSISSLALGNSPGFWVSERLIQEFDTENDLRFKNNFTLLESFYPGDFTRGTAVATRWEMVPDGIGLDADGTPTMVYGSNEPGAYELKLAGFLEENLIMQAEAQAHLGNANAALKIVDQLHDMQGSGLPHLAGTTPALSLMEIIRRERRIQVAFTGLSFYDARRWGVIDNGRTGCTVFDKDGNLWTNATIDYGFMDYWDVPDNELAYNPAGAGSAPVVNPKYPH